MLDMLAHATDAAYLLQYGEGAGITALTQDAALLTSPALAQDRRIAFILPDDEFMALVDAPMWADAWPTRHGDAAERWMELD